MLPRVTAALTQFIKPIAGARAQTGVRDREKDHEPPPQPESKAKDEKREPHLKLVPPPEEQVDLAPPSQDPRVVAAPGSPSVATAFLELFNRIQLKRVSLVRWLGKQAYDRAIRRQKREGTFRKGTMIDRRID